MSAIFSPIRIGNMRLLVLGVFFLFFWTLFVHASWFIQRRDVGPPRMRIDDVTYLWLLMIPAAFRARAIFLVGLGAALAFTWLNSRALRKERAWRNVLHRDSEDRAVLIVPDLSRRLVGEDCLLVPRACLDRLSDAELDVLLARQDAPQSRRLLALLIPFPALIVGVRAVPPSLLPLVAVVGMLCQWALTVWVYRRLDAEADAEAIQATGDPATYIQALVKADRLMQEIPRRHRMCTWWLFPASLASRIAAIARHVPEAPRR